jgi:GTPase Era involved in 16S rRNA processing
MAKKKSVIRAQNIVIFGAMGAGKSSLVNLIADQNIAKTGSDLKRCTLTWTKYVLPRLFNDEQQYNIFDTMGIENPEIESPEYHQSIQNASQLLRELDDCGGTSLLVYCVEKSRDARHAFKSNYQLFHEVLYQRRVPIVMVVTCLEGEEVMEDWWERNRASLEASEIVVAGHACITTLKDEAKYEASREAVRELIRRHAAGTPVRGGWKKEGKVGAFMRRFLRQTSSEDKRLQDKLQKDLQAQCGMEPKLASKVANTFTYA